MGQGSLFLCPIRKAGYGQATSPIMPIKFNKSMAQQIILSKESSESEIKAYFIAVLKLSQSDDEFPVNLDEVWMLVYGQKSDAVSALKLDFIENVDYQVLRKNPQNPNGGRPTNEYKLTVSCMEFFIARKVRAVFEVYRKVFHHTAHKTIEDKKTPQQLVLKDQITWVKETKKLLNLDNHSTLGMLQKIADPLGLPLPEFVDEEAALPISELLKQKGIMNKKGKHMSGQEGNRRLLEAGLIEQVTRHSKSKGKDVPQWVITKKGEKYGKMHQYKDSSFPSPIWFLKTADELLSLMNVA